MPLSLYSFTLFSKPTSRGLHLTMAPMKRSRAQADYEEGEEYEVVGVESAQSSLRQDSVSRAK